MEKLIADLFANKQLKKMLSYTDYPQMLENIFNMYIVDPIKMLRFARRRNKEKEQKEFLQNRSDMELYVLFHNMVQEEKMIRICHK